LFFSFPAQRSRAARSDETEKTLQAIERKGEKKFASFVTEKLEVNFLEKGKFFAAKKLVPDYAQE
jgi:hypothetical protein